MSRGKKAAGTVESREPGTPPFLPVREATRSIMFRRSVLLVVTVLD